MKLHRFKFAIVEPALVVSALSAGVLSAWASEFYTDWYAYLKGAAVGLLFYAPTRTLVFLLNRGLHHIAEDPDGSSEVRQLVAQFRARAQRLKIACRYTLLAILVTLVGGVWLFLYADVVARQSTFGYQLVELQNRLDDFLLPYSYRRKPPTLEELRPLLSEFRSEIATQLGRVVESNKARDSTEIIISTLSTRIGTVLLLLFLVQILVSLYRYNAKLAAFYDGRADTLQMMGNIGSLHFDQIAKLTLADSLDFGKTDQLPAERAIELLRQAIAGSDKKAQS